MNGAWSFYDPATGRFAGRTFSGPVSALAANTPPGLAAIAGLHNHETHRVTLATGEVEQWRDPRPSDDHEWAPEEGAWRVSPAAQRRAALEQISNVEAGQARAVREALLELLPAEKGARLRAIDDQIKAARPHLARQDPETT